MRLYQFRNKPKVRVLALLIVLLFTGCSQENNLSGFLQGSHGASPVRQDYSGARPEIYVSRPEHVSVIIYTHGNRRPQRREDCSVWHNGVPPSLRNLHGEHILVYYHCSTSIDRPLLPFMAGNWIFRRAEELEAIVAELRSAGIPSERIYLSGHSAGGWSALMAAREFADQFNGIIAFAPAFAGRRSEEKRYPRWRQKIRPRQINYVLEAEEIRALVFAYEDDPFERPKDLSFLAEAYPATVRIAGYRCGTGHVTHLRDCQKKQTSEEIADFIEYSSNQTYEDNVVNR